MTDSRFSTKGLLKAYEFSNKPISCLSPIYWIAGEEPLGQLEATDHIRRYLRQQNFDERLIFEGNARADWASMVFHAQERSMFSNQKWIEIKLTSLKLGKQGQEGFLSLLHQATPEVVLLITSEKPDATIKKTSFYEYAQQHGCMIDSSPITVESMPLWLNTRLKRLSLQAGPDVLEWLTHHLEGNLLAADQEIKKLALLYPNQTLTLEQVETAVAQLAKHDLDSLILAIMKGDSERVAIAITTLEAEGEAPPRLVWVLYDLVRGLRSVCEGLQQRTPINVLARQFRFWGNKEAVLPHIINRFPKDLSKQELAFGRLITRCAQLDALGKGLDDKKSSGLFWQEARRFCLSLSGLKILKGLI
jgi:DNA polymerase-3 subunit delta